MRIAHQRGGWIVLTYVEKGELVGLPDQLGPVDADAPGRGCTHPHAHRNGREAIPVTEATPGEVMPPQDYLSKTSKKNEPRERKDR